MLIQFIILSQSQRIIYVSRKSSIPITFIYQRNINEPISPSCESTPINVIILFHMLQYDPPMTIIYDTARKKEPPPATQYLSERELCLKYFEKWSEQDQIEFVENLLSRMCHYQHGHINTYLKPMLQRDFISLLPSEYSSTSTAWCVNVKYMRNILSRRKRSRSCSRKYIIIFGRGIVKSS